MSQKPQAKKIWRVTMSDEVYCSLTPELRAAFDRETADYDDYDLLKDNEEFLKLYKAARTANKALSNFKWKQRYGSQ